MFYVYIVKCADDSLYVGATNNLSKRLVEHNQSRKGAHYTKIRRPVVLQYSEDFKILQDARKREAEIKSWPRAQKLTLVNLK
ncbi:GIY-YIG nuclease family protein [Patescibacteria group bacterium]|nr:GIY-YIG nuclease family protein [Patescibacteria group bacterium]